MSVEAAGAALYIVFAPGFLTAWGMGNEGNYPDVLALGTLMLALGSRYLADEIDGVPASFWMGLLGGIAFWIHILATYYLVAAVGILAPLGFLMGLLFPQGIRLVDVLRLLTKAIRPLPDQWSGLKDREQVLDLKLALSQCPWPRPLRG